MTPMLSQILADCPDGVVVFDADGQIMAWNAALTTLTGLSESEVLGRPLRGVLPWQADSERDDFIRSALAGASGSTRGVLYPAHAGVPGVDNRKICQLKYGALRDEACAGGFAYVRDLSHELRLVEASRESEHRFRKMADDAPVYLWMAEIDGRCTWFNQQWLDFTGKTLAEEQGYGWAEGIHFEDFQRGIDVYMAAFNERRRFSMEYRLLRHDGAYRWILDNGAPRYHSDGTFAGYVGSCIDITELKNIQQERDQLHAQERVARSEAERLYREAQAANRTKDEFLATLSHELRTPMNAILGWSSLLCSGDAPFDEYANIFTTIERNARAQTRLIEDLLDVSKIITGKLTLENKPVDLWPVVQQVIDSMTLSIDARNLALTLDGSASVGLVSGDATRLSQIVWNLVSNAVKFTPVGGRIEIKLTRNGSQAVLTIKDSGEGVDPAILARIFDRFRQADGSTSRRHGGLGLGLAIVRHLTELHGGTVQAESEGAGRGSQFTIHLPLIAVQLPGAARHFESRALRSAAADTATLTGVHVLVVDDSPDALMLLRAVLKRYGAEVFTAASVAEAMQVLAQQDPDVIVSDISMPDETGFDLLRKVKAIEVERRRPYPVAALTAHARKEEREVALLAGFHAYIAKPFDQKALIQTLEQLALRRKELPC